MSRIVFLASDHGGLNLKQAIADHLRREGLDVRDLGPETAASCDYPQYARDLCREVLGNHGALGILICGTGLGMSMAANRIASIRAALCGNEYMARMARAHNDANVLCLGERTTGAGLALSIVDSFLAASFEGGRHQRRIDLFDAAGQTTA